MNGKEHERKLSQHLPGQVEETMIKVN